MNHQRRVADDSDFVEVDDFCRRKGHAADDRQVQMAAGDTSVGFTPTDGLAGRIHRMAETAQAGSVSRAMRGE